MIEAHNNQEETILEILKRDEPTKGEQVYFLIGIAISSIVALIEFWIIYTH